MNNRYIFRGKRKDNGEWETGFLVITRYSCSDEQYFIADKMTGYHTPVIPETVGQCTGLKDKNGKWIFEHDILEYLDSYSDFDGEHTEFMNKGEVAYGEGSYFVTNRSSVEMSDLAYKNVFDGTVIGNIHDNPELLEVEK